MRECPERLDFIVYLRPVEFDFFYLKAVQTTPMGKHFILIAEDDNDDQYLFKTALEECGIAAETSYLKNGEELIRFVSALKADGKPFPNFILLDLNMPKMDGREVLKKLKTDEAFRKIPVVVFSTTKSVEEVKRCYDLGANTYVVKPVYYKSLMETIRQICNYWFETAALVEDV